MSSGKLPEYTMLTPLPLTPDVMPHDMEQLVSLGLAMPCELVPHYYSLNVVPPTLGPPLLLEGPLSDPPNTPGRNLTSPEAEEHDEDEEEDEEDRAGATSGLSGEVDSEVGPEGMKLGKDPFAPQCKIPLPTPFSPYEYWLEPSFIRRRNERERQRVRNVNDGFERLKSHLPIGTKDKDKRLSKVEILRMAIRYIHNLQEVLRSDPMGDSKENVNCLSDSD